MRGMRFASAVLVLVLLVLGLLPSCTPKATPVPTPALATPTPMATPKVAPPTPVAQATPSPTTRPAQASPAWQVEWERTLAEAKKEAKVVVYTNAGVDARSAMVKHMKEKFGIAMESVAGGPTAIAERALTLRRAGIYEVDVIIVGASTQLTILKPGGALDPLEPTLILPEVRDPKMWYGGELPWVDKDHYILGFLAYLNPSLVINTDVVKEGEAKAYKDLLDPKWKGKMTLYDPTIPGAAFWWFSAVGNKIMGMDYMRGLAKQEPMVTRDARMQAEWVGRGKYPIGIALKTGNVGEIVKVGLPVKIINPTEGIYMVRGVGIMTLANKAPHPNAARVFINWLLTREGQLEFTKAELSESARLDVSADFLESALRRDPRIKYVLAEDEEAIMQIPATQKLAREIFGPLR